MYQPISERLGQILRGKFSEEAVSALFEAFEEFSKKDAVTSEEHERGIQELKYQIKLVEVGLTERIERIRAEIALEIERIKAELIERIEANRVEMKKVKAELIEKIEESRASLLKYMISFFVTQTLSLASLIIVLFKLFK